MTIRTSWFTMDNKIGVDLNHPEAVAVTTAPEIPGTSHNLGDVVQGNDGSRWMFVKASATVSANNMIAIAATNAAESLTTTHLASGIYTIGISQMAVTAAATGEYFWAILEARNGAAVNAYGTCAPGTQLYLHSSQAGAITTTATGYVLQGIYAMSTLSATTTTLEVAMYTEVQATTSV